MNRSKGKRPQIKESDNRQNRGTHRNVDSGQTARGRGGRRAREMWERSTMYSVCPLDSRSCVCVLNVRLGFLDSWICLVDVRSRAGRA